MPNKTSPGETEDLEKARADLKDVQSRAATELAEKGHASAETDDKVAGNLQRIRNIIEKD